MNYDNFINQWLGKSIDYDGVYGAQCCDEINQYLLDNGKAYCIPWGGNAKDYANHPRMLQAFDWTDNNPNDYYQYPKRGDIIIWNGDLPGSGGAGHIAIFDKIVSPGVFQSLDQNWGGQYVHFVPNHNWGYILGWFSPKAEPAPPPAPVTPPAPDPAPANPPAIPPVAIPPSDPIPEPAPEPTPPIVTPPDNLGNWLQRLIKSIIDWLSQWKKG